MKLFAFSLLGLMSGAAVLAAEGSADLADPKNRTSYALGVNFGTNLKNQDVDVNLDKVMAGIRDALSGDTKLTPQEMAEVFQKLRAQITERQARLKVENKEAGAKWLAENAKKEGVQTTPSGLQYKVIEEGTGESPTATDKVSVYYTGKLINGTVFDSTSEDNPAEFQLNRVIPGWTEGIQKMKEGAEYELYIPANLAYGERGRPNIPPNSVLIFNVKLLDVVDQPQASARPSGSQPVTSDIIKVPSAEALKKGAKIEIIKPEDLAEEIAKEKARKEREGEAP